MRNYYNYISGEDEDIDTAQAFYIICLNPGLQTYKVVASPQALNTLQNDPETRIAQYWPLNREQIDNAPQNQIFYDGNIRKAPFSLDQIQECFRFNPQIILPSSFGPPAPVQQQILPLIQQAIQEGIQGGLFTLQDIEAIDMAQVEHLTKPECIQAIQNAHTTIDQLADMSLNDLAYAIETGNSPGHGMAFH